MATPGPWATRGGSAVFGDGSKVSYVYTDHDDPNGCIAYEVPEPDAAFIAAARTALPALLDEVERLREALTPRDGSVGTVSMGNRTFEEMLADRDSLKVECERLRGEAVKYREAVADKLHFDMKAIIHDTPENLMKRDRDSLASQCAELRAALGEALDGWALWAQFKAHESPGYVESARARIAELRSVAAEKAGGK
jgi:hypothetical protein